MQSRPSREQLIKLGQHRWMIWVLAALMRSSGGRFAQLRNNLDLPRDSLVKTIDAAIAAGWVMRNPGHGHPLRPEVILTEAGKELAEVAQKMVEVLERQSLTPAMLNRWSLPLLAALAEGYDRFNELARSLPQATPRALSQSLQRLVANDLIGREIEPGYPPSSRYRLTERGRLLALAA